MSLNLHQLREDYRQRALDLQDLSPNPFEQFKQWFREVQLAKIPEANAMALATASAEGHPSCRMVLLKKMDERGFIFFTNKESRKGRDLAANPYACATFYWHELERQVIIDGPADLLTQEETESYFATRPRGSQLGSWASHQDEVVTSREVLEMSYKHYEQEFSNQLIPMPSYWGGYLLKPDRIEFWQGRQNRLHDRFRYLLSGNQWKIERLAP